jgi:ankyrin repeat protein
VVYLLSKEAKVISKDKNGRTALLLAARNGQLRSASLLLVKGAPFDLPDKNSNYAIHYAAAYDYPEVIELLARAGANINALNMWKSTPLAIAIAKNNISSI